MSQSHGKNQIVKSGRSWVYAVGLAIVSKVFDLSVIDMFVNLVGGVVRGFGALFRRFQTGSLQNYAYYFIVGLFLMVCVFLIGGGTSV